MAVFFEDTFTGTDGAVIRNRTPDTGTGWTLVDGSDWRIDNGRAAPSGSFDHILADDLADTADYDVQADYVHTGSVSTLRTGPGITGRATGNNMYIRVDSRDTGIGLVENNGGTFDTIGTFAHTWVAGEPVTVKLELRGTTAKVYVDGVERISGTVTITDRNQAGMRTENQATENLDGIKLDNFIVSNPATAPNDPTGVTTLKLSWTDNTGGTASHRVYFRTTAGPGAWTLALTVDPGVTTTFVPMDNSSSRVEHDYAVAAVSGGSESDLVLAENAQARVTHTPLTE